MAHLAPCYALTGRPWLRAPLCTIVYLQLPLTAPLRSPAVTDSARQPAASSTDCDPDRLASMISLC